MLETVKILGTSPSPVLTIVSGHMLINIEGPLSVHTKSMASSDFHSAKTHKSISKINHN